MQSLFENDADQKMVEPEDTLDDLSTEERERYLRWWRKYRTLGWLMWGGVGLIALAAWLVRSGRIVDDGPAFNRLMYAGVALFLGCRVWRAVTVCPRCGVAFRGGLLTLLTRFKYPISSCYGCDLELRALKSLRNAPGFSPYRP